MLLLFVAKLPKNYNPDVTPDPERWLPKKERSYYRGKRKDKKKDIGKICNNDKRNCKKICIS